MASVNRAPFDLAEAESELVAGFHTEYSGFRWSIFFLAEYGSMLGVSLLASILFFGGWNGPIPIFELLGHSGPSFAVEPSWIGYFANLVGVFNVILKAVVGVTVMMWARWTLPRLRIDQVMTTCLKYCVPIAAAMFLGTIFWQYNQLPAGKDLLPGANRGMINEGWLGDQDKTAAKSTAAVAASESRPSAPVVVSQSVTSEGGK
jgi:NADH-quinone oxidoreductase subunit H